MDLKDSKMLNWLKGYLKDTPIEIVKKEWQAIENLNIESPKVYPSNKTDITMTTKENIFVKIIPRVEVLLEKEKKHLDSLISLKNQLLKESKRWFNTVSKKQIIDIENMIDTTKDMVSHIELRLDEYKELSKTLS